MSVRRAMGTLRPAIYYVNRKSERHPIGYVILAPETDTPKHYIPEGFEVMEAGTLAEVTKLQKKLQEQDRIEGQIESEAYRQQHATAREEKRKRLVQMMLDSGTSEHDKQFIERYLQVREERRAYYEQRFAERTAYMPILAFDEKKAGQEIVDRVISK